MKFHIRVFFENLSRLSFIKIEQEQRVLCMKTNIHFSITSYSFLLRMKFQTKMLEKALGSCDRAS